jgi:hypothetical protein
VELGILRELSGTSLKWLFGCIASLNDGQSGISLLVSCSRIPQDIYLILDSKVHERGIRFGDVMGPRDIMARSSGRYAEIDIGKDTSTSVD